MSDCGYSSYKRPYYYLYDSSVTCSIGIYCRFLQSIYYLATCVLDGADPFDIQLDGYGGSKGQLQIYWSGRWQPVAITTSNWTSENSEVVCRQLGYAPYNLPGIFVKSSCG